jgi:hypothetical protein
MRTLRLMAVMTLIRLLYFVRLDRAAIYVDQYARVRNWGC